MPCSFMESFACALLELTEAPSYILRVFYFVGIGITTTASPALDIAALCLSSRPAAISSDSLFHSVCNLDHINASCQLTADPL